MDSNFGETGYMNFWRVWGDLNGESENVLEAASALNEIAENREQVDFQDRAYRPRVLLGMA